MKEKRFFSIVIPTRNKPLAFHRALESVLAQHFQDFEIVVVNDGSSPQHRQAYQDIEKEVGDHARFFHLPERNKGHGPSFARNTGADAACGDYLLFLDDDDFWTDSGHLARVHNAIVNSGGCVDAYYCNQHAYFSNGELQTATVWLEDLIDIAVAEGQEVVADVYTVSAETLLKSRGFAHLNCSVISADLYSQIGGYDEALRYEEDRDLFFRTLDQAKTLMYSPCFIGKHNIPDPKVGNNVSTQVNHYQKSLCRIWTYEKCLFSAKNTVLRRRCHQALSYVYKHLSCDLHEKKRLDEARVLAYKGLAHRYTLKWQLYCWFLVILTWLKRAHGTF